MKPHTRDLARPLWHVGPLPLLNRGALSRCWDQPMGPMCCLAALPHTLVFTDVWALCVRSIPFTAEPPYLSWARCDPENSQLNSVTLDVGSSGELLQGFKNQLWPPRHIWDTRPMAVGRRWGRDDTAVVDSNLWRCWVLGIGPVGIAMSCAIRMWLRLGEFALGSWRNWKSPRGGVNRRNLKFINLNTH
jgi:hypothetical protein